METNELKATLTELGLGEVVAGAERRKAQEEVWKKAEQGRQEIQEQGRQRVTAIENKFREKLEPLAPEYTRRSEAARRAMQALSEFAAIEIPLHNQVDELFNEFDSEWGREMNRFNDRVKFNELVRQAGLADHFAWKLPQAQTESEKTVLACLLLIVRRTIEKGVLHSVSQETRLC